MRLLLALMLLMPCSRAIAQYDISLHFEDTLYRKYIFIDTANHNNIWQTGKPSKILFDSAYTLPNAIVTDTLHPYPTNDSSAFVIRVPQFVLVDTPNQKHTFIFSLSFNYQLDIDAGDSANVDVSLDSGRTWQPATGLNGPLHLDTSTNGWAGEVIYLPHGNFSQNIPQLYIRFSFRSDAIPSNRDGWMIDDMWIYYWFEGNVPEVAKARPIIYPNPSDGNVIISGIKSPVRLQLFAPDGRKVYETTVTGNNNVHLPVPPGIYLLRYTTGEIQTSERLIIR